MTTVGEPDLLRRTADAIPNAFAWPPPPSDDAADILWLDPDSPPPPAANVPAQVPTAPEAAGVPVSYLLLAGVAFEWQDVVALVQELGAQLSDSTPSGSLLALDAITLEPEGRVRVKLDTGTLPIVRSLGHVLQQLLIDQPSPANLRLIALQANSEASTIISIENLRSALAKFERPDRRKALAALYERARAATPPLPILPVPGKLERETGTPALAIVHEAERQTPKQPPQVQRWRIPALVMSTVAIASIATVFVIRGRSEAVSPPQAAVDRLLQSVPNGDVPEPSASDGPEQDTNRLSPSPAKSAVRATGSPVRAPRPASPAGAGPTASGGSGSAAQTVTTVRQPAPRIPGNAEEEFRYARALFDSKEYAAATAAFQRVIALISNEEPSTSSSTLKSTATEMAALSRAAVSPSADTRVYTALDPGVIEPVPLAQYIPEEPGPGAAPGEPSVLELVIDTRGIVESVRLRNPLNRYRDKWWLPAAKTWRFQPAMKDGKPVKFLKRVTITAVAPVPSDP